MPPARCTLLKQAALNANTYVCSSYLRESEFPTVKLLRQGNKLSLSNFHLNDCRRLAIIKYNCNLQKTKCLSSTAINSVILLKWATSSKKTYLLILCFVIKQCIICDYATHVMNDNLPFFFFLFIIL